MTTPFVPLYAGSQLTAAEWNEVQPAQIIKPTNQSVTSSTTLVNDNSLFLPVAVANATYVFRSFLIYKGGTQGSSDLKLEWAIPSGATLTCVIAGIGTGGGSFVGQGFTLSGTVALGTAGSTVCGVLFYGTLVMSSTTGTLQLEWAQNTSSATATTVEAGSLVELVRVS